MNQAKLTDALEEINIQTVNNIGIDINLVVEHEHLQNQLQFVSGLGPRKAYRYLNKLKELGRPLHNRDEMFKRKFFQKLCFLSLFGFIKIYVAPEKRPDVD